MRSLKLPSLPLTYTLSFFSLFFFLLSLLLFFSALAEKKNKDQPRKNKKKKILSDRKRFELSSAFAQRLANAVSYQ
jgi:hypothetical protein